MFKKLCLICAVSYNLFAYDLTVEVHGLRNSDGLAQFSLYKEGAKIPDEHYERYTKQIKVPIHNNSAKATFKNLPTNKYAVNFLHDENKDGKIEKGFILPEEGIGFTNFENINILHKPNFEKASFVLDKDISKEIKVIYF
jgi:uncharacterized protein (DUF2141 family)